MTCLRPVNPDFVYLSIILADRNSAEPRLPRVFFAMSRSAASFFASRDIPKNYLVEVKEYNTLMLSH